MIPGNRMVHPVHAFGKLVGVEGGIATIELDGGESIQSPIAEWEDVYVDPAAILDVTALSDEELDIALERFRQMRVTGAAKRPRTRALASRASGPKVSEEDFAKLLEMAKADPELAEALRNTGIDI